ncbi:TrmB family transcriptional regulator [Modestobacter sp. SYSU DS0511]
MDHTDGGEQSPDLRGLLLQQLVEIGIEPKAARFYLMLLEMRQPTVAEVAMASGITRSHAYDLTGHLRQRGLVELVDSDRVKRRAGTKVLRPNDPGRLLGEWHQRKRILDEVVPRLRAIHEKAGPFPRTSHYDGAAGIRQALFETLNWGCDLRAIMSMEDLYAAIGQDVMEGYVRERGRRRIFLKVIRSAEKDTSPGWLTSDPEFREARWAPPSYVYTMTSIIGTDSVVMLSSTDESFAVKIESSEYATMQANLFEVLWGVSEAR